MKKLLVSIALLMASIAAHADIFTMPVNAGSQANASGVSDASNAGNGNGAQLSVNSYGGGDSTLRSAPTVYTPGLVTSFSQASCMVSAAGGFSLVGFGASGGVPVDGEHCDFRLNIQQAAAIAITGMSYVQMAGNDIDAGVKTAIIVKSGKMLDAAQDMTCLYSDRMRAVMEAHGLCEKVKDMATLDHRWNQPRSTQIDYSNE